MLTKPWLFTPALAAAILCALLTSAALAQDETEYTGLRKGMVEEIEADVKYTSLYIGKLSLDERVMQAMGKVPRHRFVPKRLRAYAYDNRPLPIGHGQTISQPYIVALMTDLLQVDTDDIALEIGTGSGYQAAILAKLVKHVYTIEIIQPLGEAASERLQHIGYDNITTRIGDGYYGWEAHAPFDVIIVTAAAGSIPPPLIKQLKPGGRMAIPVGGVYATQQLILVEKDMQGKITTKQVLPVRFVPLTGKH